MLGQMTWLPINYPGENVLHLRTNPHEPWKPYKAYPKYAVPDYEISNGSPGWATYHKLQKAGWTLVSTQNLSHRGDN